LQLPFLGKDQVKELMFDNLGWSDREWSRRLGAAAIDLLYYMMETELKAGRSFLVECNFSPAQATARFRELKARYGFEAFQVQCQTDGPVLVKRFKRRAESGERHPGHGDHLTYDEIAPVLLEGRYPPLDIGGTIFYLDTTDFARVDYEGLAGAVRQFISEADRD
jgi:hypothetical protein